MDCDVIRADGGTRTASITASFVALGLAVKKLMEVKALGRSPLRDYVAATSVGIVGRETLLDLDYAEDSSAEVDLNVVMTGAGKLVEVQAAAEGRVFSLAELGEMVEIAQPAVRALFEKQKAILNFEF